MVSIVVGTFVFSGRYGMTAATHLRAIDVAGGAIEVARTTPRLRAGALPGVDGVATPERGWARAIRLDSRA